MRQHPRIPRLQPAGVCQKDKEDILGHCFFPEIPWDRKNFFGNGRWNSGVITGKDGHMEFQCKPIS